MTDLKDVGAPTGAAVAIAPAPPLIVPALAKRAPKSARSGLRRALAEALEQRRLFILLPFATIAGIIASILTPAAPEPILLWSVGAVTLLGLALGLRWLTWLRVLALFAAFWFGFSLLAIHAAAIGTAMLTRPAYGIYDMRVERVLSEAGGELRAIFSDIVPQGTARSLPIRHARLLVKSDVALAPGDVVRAPVRFYPVPGPVVPNGFDTQFHAYFDGVGAYGNTTGAVERISEGAASAPGRIVDGIRRGIASRIDAVLPQPTAGIARALITGDQSAVVEDVRETVATAGLAHVLSVSGLHLSLVAGLVLVTLRGGLSLVGGLDRFVSTKRLAAAGAILAALGYFAISGGNVAAMRSTIMIVLVLGAIVFGRRALTMRNVAIAALIVLVSDPPSIFRPSFQLSFAAVVALIAAWELVQRREEKDRSLVMRVYGYFLGIVATSLVAGAATLLFSVYHFQQTSPLGVIGNLFSLPLVGFVMMPAALLATLAMPLGWEAPFLLVMGWSIDRMVDLAALVAAWSGGIDASPLLTPLALGLGLAAFAWFAFLHTWHRLLAPALLVPLLIIFALDRPPDVLIADTTQAIAMRNAGDLELVAGKVGFAVDVWRESYGEPIVPTAQALACDSLGCFGISAQGFTIAIVRDPAAFHEDCALADLVIARRDAPTTCAAGTIIDAEQLRTRGVHWLRWDASRKTFEVRPAIPAIDRPWRTPPG